MPFKLRLSELHHIGRVDGTGIVHDTVVMDTRYIRIEVLVDDPERLRMLIEALGGTYEPPPVPEKPPVKMPKLYKQG